MFKYFKILSIATALVVVSGCGDSVAKEVKDSNTKEQKAYINKDVVPKAKAQNTETEVKEQPKEFVTKFYTIFKDGAKIAPKGKPMLLVFGQEKDEYTQKLKNDILTDEDLATKIKFELTPIYIDATQNRAHKFKHSGELMDVDTKTLISIYNINATPTLIFTDKEGNSIFVVPGYMPPKQFKVTIDFVKSGVWKGKDRKNGEVYKALKEYYLEHGVSVKKAKK